MYIKTWKIDQLLGFLASWPLRAEILTLFFAASIRYSDQLLISFFNQAI